MASEIWVVGLGRRDDDDDLALVALSSGSASVLAVCPLVQLKGLEGCFGVIRQIVVPSLHGGAAGDPWDMVTSYKGLWKMAS